MKFKTAILSSLSAGIILGMTAQASAQDDWPQRPLENSVWSSAGGGTDFSNRLISKALEDQLDTRISVSNRTGGGGGVAMNHVWSNPHEGYYLLGASEQMQNVAVMGFHDTTTADWRWYMVAGAPGSIAVHADSPYETVEDLIEASEQDPESITLSHCATGCVWHLKALAFEGAAEVDFNMIPYEGSAPAMTALLTGESDVVVSSIQEQAEYIKAGKMRSLGMINMEGFEASDLGSYRGLGQDYPNIQAIPTRQWLGFAVPADTPKNITDKLDEAFVSAMEDPDLIDRLESRYLSVMGHYGDEAKEILMEMEQGVSWKLHELGLAEFSPEKFGIKKPN